MVSAVLMAGYNNKWEVRRYAKVVAEHYGEKFIETGYKPLREFKSIEDGKEISRPLIQYTLEKLFKSDLISEIVIVGHRMLIEQRLGEFIDQFEKPCRILNQNAQNEHYWNGHEDCKKKAVSLLYKRKAQISTDHIHRTMSQIDDTHDAKNQCQSY